MSALTISYLYTRATLTVSDTYIYYLQFQVQGRAHMHSYDGWQRDQHSPTHPLTHSILERRRINFRRHGYGRKSGVVKMWNNQRGFGFIKQNDAGGDVFCHVTDINDGNALRAGDSVRFSDAHLYFTIV